MKINRIKIKGKKGELTTQEILELILAAAGIFILVILLWKLFAPGFEKDKETAKAYLETLKKEIEKADNNQIGEFSFWQPDTGIAFVYFGNQNTFNAPQGYTLSTSKRGENKVCMCRQFFIGKKSECDSENCISLKYPVRLGSLQHQVLVFAYPQKFSIQKKDKEYLITFSQDLRAFYEQAKQNAKKDLDSFKTAISNAENTGESNFSISSYGPTLIYFGNLKQFSNSFGQRFKTDFEGENASCLCYSYFGDISCSKDNCISLANQAKWKNWDKEWFLITYPQKINIKKDSGQYIVSEIK